LPVLLLWNLVGTFRVPHLSRFCLVGRVGV
jgi:hypothetical protein